MKKLQDYLEHLDADLTILTQDQADIGVNIEGPFRKMNIDIKDIINDHILSANNLLDLSDVSEEICSSSLKTIQNGNTIMWKWWKCKRQYSYIF